MLMEYDNSDSTWRRPSGSKNNTSKCNQIPRRSTTAAVVVLGLAVLSCLLGYCVLSETLPYESKTLRLVIVLFRHGARTPVKSYKSDPFKNYQWPDGLGSLTNLFRHGARTPVKSYKSDPFKNYQWPDGLGSLTNIGKLQMFELGKKYRAYYSNFVSDEYYEKDIFIRSSDKSRCLMSAYTFLAGLFPPTERQMWHPEIPWQPIPVHSLPKELDNDAMSNLLYGSKPLCAAMLDIGFGGYKQIVAGTKYCKSWKDMYIELLSEQNANPKFADLFDYLSKNTNQSMRSVLDVDFLYSTFLSQQDAGLKLPEWTKTVFPNRMRTPFMLSLALLSYNETLQRLKVGPLLSEIREKLGESVSRTNEDRVMYLYSGHDVNVVGLWRSLGFTQLLEPEYGASIVLELHEEVEQETFYVKAFYRNNTKIEVPTELKMSFCNNPCTYNEFLEYVDKLIPKDWETECRNDAI